MAQKEEQKDLGFGLRSEGRLNRALNKDGSFNVKRTGQTFFDSFELYHWLISISWKHFILVVLLWYTIVNLIFAALYAVVGVEGLTGIDNTTRMSKMFDAFFFSSQTLTTLGYGRIAPVGMGASIVAAVESMFGVLSFSLATGLLYGRFSRPQSKIAYSTHAVVAPYRSITGFMFRVVNLKKSQLIEAQVEISISMQKPDGKSRIFESLALERDRIQFFPLSWTIVHPIDESSPLFGMTEDTFKKSDAEFIIMIKAFDESFSQTVYSRSSYDFAEVIWGAKFISMMSTDKDGNRLLQMDKLDSMEKAELPVLLTAQ